MLTTTTTAAPASSTTTAPVHTFLTAADAARAQGHELGYVGVRAAAGQRGGVYSGDPSKGGEWIAPSWHALALTWIRKGDIVAVAGAWAVSQAAPDLAQHLDCMIDEQEAQANHGEAAPEQPAAAPAERYTIEFIDPQGEVWTRQTIDRPQASKYPGFNLDVARRVAGQASPVLTARCDIRNEAGEVVDVIELPQGGAAAAQQSADSTLGALTLGEAVHVVPPLLPARSTITRPAVSAPKVTRATAQAAQLDLAASLARGADELRDLIGSIFSPPPSARTQPMDPTVLQELRGACRPLARPSPRSACSQVADVLRRQGRPECADALVRPVTRRRGAAKVPTLLQMAEDLVAKGEAVLVAERVVSWQPYYKGERLLQRRTRQPVALAVRERLYQVRGGGFYWLAVLRGNVIADGDFATQDEAVAQRWQPGPLPIRFDDRRDFWGDWQEAR